jgi:iron complex outermembrane recepter protein
MGSFLVAGGALGADDGPRSVVLEEIIVTAQKRNQDVQDIPIAVTALTAEVRELIGLTTIEDFTNFVPGLTYEGQLDRANIRGAGRVTNQPGTDPAVGLYVDGFYNSSTTTAARSTIFNERVEVLRGPQSSLYGRNTTGGAINTVSRGARDTWGGEGRATYGSYERKVIEGTATGPLTDWLRFRVTAALTDQDEGYFTNVSGFADEGGVQDDEDYVALLTADLGENAELTLRVGHLEFFSLARFSSNFNQPAYQTTGLLGVSPITGLPSSAAGTFASRGNGLQPSSLYNGAGIPTAQVYTVPNPASPANRRRFSTNVPSDRVTEESDTALMTLTWNLPFADFKWVGGITEYQFHSFTDSDGIAREYYDYTPAASPGDTVRVVNGSRLRFYEDKQYWSNEFNLASNGEGDVQWLVGLYQYKEEYEQIPIAQETSNPEQTQLHTVYARPAAAITGTAAQQAAAYAAMTQVAYQNPFGAINSGTGTAEVATYAAFGQVDWQFAEKWKAIVGGRFSRDEKEGSETRFAVIWDPSTVGSLAKAYDNSAPFDCITDPNRSHSFNPNYQSTINAATGQEIAVTSQTTSYTSSCRSRVFKKRTWDDWTGTAGLEWTPTDDLLTYAKYSRGYKSGAIRFGSLALDAETDPEYINSFEIGAKTTIANRLQVNASAFYYDYQDYQFPVTEREDDGAGGSVTRQTYTNLEEAESYGLELEGQWNPVSTLAFLMSYSYLKTEILSDLYLVDTNDLSASLPDASPDRIVVSRSPTTGLPTVVAQNIKGNSLPSSPEQKVAVNATYTFNFAAGSLIPSVSYSWRDKLASGGLSVSAFSRGRNSTPAYDTWDARLTWADAQGRYTVYGYVANAFDDETVNSASSTTFNGEPAQLFNLNPPRTWGVQLQYRFGSDTK